MISLKFSTNISSALSVMEVIPYIESLPAICSWSIDNKAPDFILQLDTEDHIQTEEIIQLFKKAGFSIVLIEKKVSNPN